MLTTTDGEDLSKNWSTFVAQSDKLPFDFSPIYYDFNRDPPNFTGQFALYDAIICAFME